MCYVCEREIMVLYLFSNSKRKREKKNCSILNWDEYTYDKTCEERFVHPEVNIPLPLPFLPLFLTCSFLWRSEPICPHPLSLSLFQEENRGHMHIW